MNEEFHEEIIFGNLPNCQELCHVVVSIDLKETKDRSVKSDYQWQLLKTRILIFSDVNILASPMLDQLRYIHVVCKRSYFTSGSLNNLLKKNNLKIECVLKLTNETYGVCLFYHFISKLAPSWNRIEKLFVEGRYFLMKRGQLAAVELNYEISEDKLFLHILPRRLWLRPVELLDFDLPLSVLEHSVSEKFYKDLSHEPQWVHVLPSFKRGRIVYVSNYIPEKCTFTDYNEIRRHWKNTYGFRLPEEGSSMTYVGVNFFGPLDFTYPLECVRRGLHLNIGDPDLIYNFVTAICTKASSICGNTLKLVNLGTPIQPHFMVAPEPKWEEKNLLSIDKYTLENFLASSDVNMFNNNSQISLCTQSQSKLGDSSDSKADTDDWFIKCSSFIEGLSQIDPKKSRSKALRKPLFMNRSRQFIKLPLKKNDFETKVENNAFPLATIPPYFIRKKQELQPLHSHLSESKEMEQSAISVSQTDGMESAAALTKCPVLYKPVFTKPKSIAKGSVTKLQDAEVNVSLISSESPQIVPPATGVQKPIFLKHKPKVNKIQTTEKSFTSGKTPSKDKAEKKPEVKRSAIIFTENEIEKLHQDGKLSKVNSASLFVFLKKNSIACKRSDKKSVLLSKAELLLNQYVAKK